MFCRIQTQAVLNAKETGIDSNRCYGDEKTTIDATEFPGTYIECMYN